MRTGNIILVSNPWNWRYPFSSLLYAIMRLVVGKWHHCALVWESPAGRMIVEARGIGVYPSNYEIWKQRWPNRHIWIIPLRCDPGLIGLHIGKRYDRRSFLFYCIWKIVFRKWIGRTGPGAADHLYCFEFAALVHQLPGWNSILPSEFVHQAQSRYWEQQQPQKSVLP